jgi:hypothetical protein
MQSLRFRLLLVGLTLCLVCSCAGLSVSKTPPPPPLWSTPVFEKLLTVVAGAEGRPFDAISAIVNDRIARAPVFPPATEKIRSDELFLLSPRNTMIRPSVWDRTFSWNWADGGSSYILHAYSKDDEVFSRRMGDARRAFVSEHDAPFVPGVEYSWDVSLCVERCNLHLSAKPILRPTFTILSAAEAAAVEGALSAVTAWCETAGVAKSEEGVAVTALALETAGLYMEEQQLLVKEIKKRSGSVLLHLVYSGALSAMNSPYGARDEYEKARTLYEKEAGTPAQEPPSVIPAEDE